MCKLPCCLVSCGHVCTYLLTWILCISTPIFISDNLQNVTLFYKFSKCADMCCIDSRYLNFLLRNDLICLTILSQALQNFKILSETIAEHIWKSSNLLFPSALDGSLSHCLPTTFNSLIHLDRYFTNHTSRTDRSSSVSITVIICFSQTTNFSVTQFHSPVQNYLQLTLRLPISYIYGAPSKARNANVVYIWTYVWQRWNSLFLFDAQCFNTESVQRGFLCHICV